MYNYLIHYALIMPFIGIILVENGFYSYSSGLIGYSNNAWLAYLFYMIVFYLSYFFFRKVRLGKIYKKNNQNLINYKNKLEKKFIMIFILGLIFFLTILIFLGGYKVLFGIVQKGEFRSKEIGILGLGFLAHMITKFFLPVLGAYASFLYLGSNKRLRDKLKLFIILTIISLTGFLWGFKSSAIIVIVPALIIIFWDLKFIDFIKLVFIFLLVLYFAALFYDREMLSNYGISPLQFILIRMTAIEGDGFWRIWDRFYNNEIQPLYWEYFKYLLNALGQKFLSSFDLAKLGSPSLINYSLSAYFTYLVNSSIESAITGEHNITVTAASEGLVFLGVPFYLLFAVFGGLLSAYFYKKIKYSIEGKKLISGSIYSTFFVFCIFAWLKGGDITSIIHISNLVGVIFTYMMLLFIEKVRLL